MSRIRQQFLAHVDRFQAETGMTDDSLGRRAMGDNKVILRLRRGIGVQLTNLERIEDYIYGERQRRAELADA